MRITLHPDILPKATISPRGRENKGQYKYFHRYQKALCQLGTHGQQTHEIYSLIILTYINYLLLFTEADTVGQSPLFSDLCDSTVCCHLIESLLHGIS